MLPAKEEKDVYRFTNKDMIEDIYRTNLAMFSVPIDGLMLGGPTLR